MLEIEKKYRLTEPDRERIIEKMRTLGAAFERDDTEENTIYGSDALLDVGAIVRIRRTEHRSLLTYKRRVEHASDVKQQIEHETEVSDAGTTDKIIQELGLLPRIIYEKRRSTWHLRDVEIAIDVLPFGLFMEIEGSMTGIKETEVLLEIEELQAEHETYPRLTARLGKRAGDVIEARFS